MARLRRTPAQLQLDEQIGRRIEKARRAKGMQASVLAERLGCSYQTLYEIESGARSCPAHRVAEIAKALEVSSDTLLGVSRNTLDSLARQQKAATV